MGALWAGARLPGQAEGKRRLESHRALPRHCPLLRILALLQAQVLLMDLGWLLG